MKRRGARSLVCLFFVSLFLVSCLGVSVQMDTPFYVVFDQEGPFDTAVLNGFRKWEAASEGIILFNVGLEPNPTLKSCTRQIHVLWVPPGHSVIKDYETKHPDAGVLAYGHTSCFSKTVYLVTGRGLEEMPESDLSLIAGHEMGHLLRLGHHEDLNMGIMSPGFPGLTEVSCLDMEFFCKAHACDPYRFPPCR